MNPLPNRVALYLTVAAGLLGALAPIVADLDIESVAGIAAGLTAIAAVVYKWLDGWSKWERGVGDVLPGEVPAPEPLDEFDEATAEHPPEEVARAHAAVPPTAPPEAQLPPKKP